MNEISYLGDEVLQNRRDASKKKKKTRQGDDNEGDDKRAIRNEPSNHKSSTLKKPNKTLKRFRSALNLFEPTISNSSNANNPSSTTTTTTTRATNEHQHQSRRQKAKQKNSSIMIGVVGSQLPISPMKRRAKKSSSSRKQQLNDASTAHSDFIRPDQKQQQQQQQQGALITLPEISVAANGLGAMQNDATNQQLQQHQQQARKLANDCSDLRASPVSLLELPEASSESKMMQIARQRRPSASNQTTINVNQQALFSAVERNQLDRARSILASKSVNVNSLSGDKLTCLDMAVLLRNARMVHLLQEFGAKESSVFLNAEQRAHQLRSLYLEARQLVEDLSRSLASSSSQLGAGLEQHANAPSAASHVTGSPIHGQSNLSWATQSQLSNALIEEKHRQLQYWRRRLELFMRMRYEFDRLKPPIEPELVFLQVTGERCLSLKIVHSLRVSPLIPARDESKFISSTTIDCKQQLAAASERQIYAGPTLLEPWPSMAKCTCDEETSAWSHPSQFVPTLPNEWRHQTDGDSTIVHCSRRPSTSARLTSSTSGNRRQHEGLFEQETDSDINSSTHRKQLGAECQFNCSCDSTKPADDCCQSCDCDCSNWNEPCNDEPEMGSSPSKWQQKNLAQKSGNQNTTTIEDRHCKIAAFNRLLNKQITGRLLNAFHQHQNQHQDSRHDLNEDKLIIGQLERDEELETSTTGSRCHHVCHDNQTNVGCMRLRRYPTASLAQRRFSRLDELRAACSPNSLANQSIAYRLLSLNHNNMDCVTASRLANNHYAAGACPAAAGSIQNNSHLYDLFDYRDDNSQDELSFEQQNRNAFRHHHQHHQHQNNNLTTSSNLSADCANEYTCDAIITKYLVQWSESANFQLELNSMVVYRTSAQPLECRIGSLASGRTYYVRVAAGNHKGYSRWRLATPSHLTPSSWRHVEGTRKRRHDELVLSKFTQLILLNKHILNDSNQYSSGLLNPFKFDQSQSFSAEKYTSVAGPSIDLISRSSSDHDQKSLISMILQEASVAAGGDQIEHGADYESTSGGYDYEQQTTTGTQSQLSSASSSVRKNLKSFFQSNSFKFHKLSNQNKRGLYLCTIVYCDDDNQSSQQNSSRTSNKMNLLEVPMTASSTGSGDNWSIGGISNSSFGASASSAPPIISGRIIVTNDDRLPVIEVVNELVSPAALLGDFYWLLKVGGTRWIDIKRLRQQLQKSHSTSTLHMRIKLLNAIEQMQLALNLEDIGRLFHKPIQSHDGSIVICTCRRAINTKLVSSLSTKWVAQSKIIPRHLRKISDSLIQAQQQQQQHQQLLSASNQLTVQTKNRNSTSSIASFDAGRNSYCGQNYHYLCDSCITSGADNSIFNGSGGGVVAQSGSRKTGSPSGSHTSLSSSTANQNIPSCDSSNCSLASDHAVDDTPNNTDLMRCSNCNKLNLPPTIRSNTTNSLGPTSNLLLGGPNPNCPRLSTSSAVYPSQTQNRSGSMYLSASVQFTSRHSQPISLGVGVPPQRSSQYLMLASLSVYDLLLYTLGEMIHFDRHSNNRLKRGLYLGFLQLSATIESMRLLVPRARPNMLPSVRVRDNSHVSKEEWQLLTDLLACGGRKSGGTRNDASSLNVNQRAPSAGVYRAKSASPSRFNQPPYYNTNQSNANNYRSDRLSANVFNPRDRSASHDHDATTTTTTMKNCPMMSASSDHLARSRRGGAEVANSCTTRMQTTTDDTAESSENVSIEDKGSCTQSDPHLHDSKTRSNRSSQTMTTTTTIRTCQEPTGSSNSQQDLHHHKQNDSDSEQKFRSDRAGSFGTPTEALPTGRLNQLNIARQHSPRDGSGNKAAPNQQQINSVSTSRLEINCGNSNRKKDASVSSRTSLNRDHSPSPQLYTNDEQDCRRASSNVDIRSPEATFIRLIGSAGRKLIGELTANLPRQYDLQLNDMISMLAALNEPEHNRVYHLELIELSRDVSFIILIPSVENICPVTTQEDSNILATNQDYMFLPMQFFETLHIGTYEPELLAKYSRLSVTLETELTLALHDHRQAFSSTELKSTKSRLTNLQEMVSITEDFWRQMRWLTDVVAFGRDKSLQSSQSGVRIGFIWSHFDSPEAFARFARRRSSSIAPVHEDLNNDDFFEQQIEAKERELGPRPEEDYKMEVDIGIEQDAGSISSLVSSSSNNQTNDNDQMQYKTSSSTGQQQEPRQTQLTKIDMLLLEEGREKPINLTTVRQNYQDSERVEYLQELNASQAFHISLLGLNNCQDIDDPFDTRFAEAIINKFSTGSKNNTNLHQKASTRFQTNPFLRDSFED